MRKNVAIEGMIMKRCLVNALLGTALIMSRCSPSVHERAGSVVTETMLNMSGAPSSMMRGQNTVKCAIMRSVGFQEHAMPRPRLTKAGKS